MVHETKATKQSEKFIDKAKELGVDESEEAFDRQLGRISRAKPKVKKEKTPDK